MAFLSIIRRWHKHEHVPIREIPRRLGVSRNTIRKYLRSELVEPKFQIPDRPSKLEPYAEKRTKLQVAHSKLCHSRAFIVRAYSLQTHEMLFDAHHHAFRVLGGVPRRGIYDNMRAAVDKVGRGKERSEVVPLHRTVWRLG